MKDHNKSDQKGSNAIANQVVQKKSNAVSLPSAQPVQLMEEEEEPAQGKFESAADTTSTSQSE